jgi:CubicO group peptidase (beta-lactamase class C family)
MHPPPRIPALLVGIVGLGLVGCDHVSRNDHVRRLLADYDGADRPGVCLLARRAGTVVYQRCVGMAELETRTPATPESNFRLASVTKQFTATAVLLLVADGRLATTTTLRAVFPDFPAWADPITIHHLLTHTSGLVDYEDLMPENDDRQITDAGVLALLRAQDSTYFPPGSAFRYSNSGYVVLAQIVEAVSGQRFRVYLDQAVFAPLGMTGTVAHVEGETTVQHRAFGYSRLDDGSWRRTDQSPTSATLGDGGIYASVQDLDRWLAVVEGRDSLLPSALATAIFHPATVTDRADVRYGYGWYFDRVDGRRRYRHDGTTIGFRNEVRWFPDDDLTLVFLSNRNEIEPGLVDSLVAAVRDR